MLKKAKTTEWIYAIGYTYIVSGPPAGGQSYGGNDRVYTCLKVRSAGGIVLKSIVNYVRGTNKENGKVGRGLVAIVLFLGGSFT
jgi:hypothetical protein